MPALQLTADDHLSRRIDAVNLKHRLGDVETDCRDRLHAWLPHNRDRPSGDHFNATYVPMGEPSTASEAVPPSQSSTPLIGLQARSRQAQLRARRYLQSKTSTSRSQMYTWSGCRYRQSRTTDLCKAPRRRHHVAARRRWRPAVQPEPELHRL